MSTTVPQTLAGKTGLVFGVANKRSIAWGIAQAWAAAGAKLIFSYQGERIKGNVEELVEDLGADTPFYPCDVSRDEDITEFFKNARTHTDRVDLLLHSVAFAPKEALENDFLSTTREAYRTAHDISAYSLVALSREAAPLMTNGGSIIAMTLLRCRESHPALQRHGCGQGEPGGVHALSRVRPRQAKGARQLHQRRTHEHPRGAGHQRVQPDAQALRATRAARAFVARWRNSARWACSWRATARRPSRGKRFTWTAVIRSSECEKDGARVA